MMTDSPAPLWLAGIDGGNLLGFLAAMGALRVLTEEAHLPVAMSWAVHGGAIRPALHFASPLTQAALLERLASLLDHSSKRHPAQQWRHFCGKDPQPCRDQFDNARREASLLNRVAADFLCAIGSDILRIPNGSSDTPLRVPREDYLLGNIKTIIEDTHLVHLQKALFAPWAYDDPVDNRSLRFDPADDSRYALRWSNPSGDAAKKKRGGMLGANRLALEALPLFPSMIQEDRRASQGYALATVGCARERWGWLVTWILWKYPCSLDVCRSLLESAGNAVSPDDRRMWRVRGILATYRSRRLTIGKTRVFTPSEPPC